MHGERRLDALVAQLAAVEDHLREATRRRGRAIEQQVGRASLVRRYFERRAAIPRRGIEAALELLRALGLDVRRSRDAGDVGADAPADDARRQRRELLAELRLAARLAVGRAQLQIAADAKEVGKSIGDAGLRENVELARVSEHTAALGAEAGFHR